VAPRHVAELEAGVLALDDLIGRQRLDDLASIGKELVAAHKRLQDLLERYKATGDEQLRRQIEREVRELRARIAELAHKIAEVKARNEVSPDFMNMPDTRKAMEQAARLDSLLAKGDARSLEDALAELGDSLSSLRDMLDKNAGDFGNSRFPQESRALAELSRKLGDLEGDQRSLAEDGRALAKEVDTELGRRMEAQQAEFLAKAKQKLEQIQRKMAGNPSARAGQLGRNRPRLGARERAPAAPPVARQRVERGPARGRTHGDGLGHLQHLSRAPGRAEPTAVAKPDRLRRPGGRGRGLARELAADLGRVVPRGGDVMSAEQRRVRRDLGQRQGSIEDKPRGVSHELGGKSESVPGAEGAAAELEEIAGQMRQAGEDLQQGDAHEGAGRADEVAQRLAKLRQSMGRKPSEGSRPKPRARAHPRGGRQQGAARMAPGTDGSHARESAREIPRRSPPLLRGAGAMRGRKRTQRHRGTEAGEEGLPDLGIELFLISVLSALSALSVVKFFLLAVPALAASESASVERLYSEWRFGEADRALAALSKAHPGEPGTLLAKGYERFMAGDFRAAVAEYKAAIGTNVAPAPLKEMLALAEGSAKVVDGYLERKSAHFVFRFPAEDAVLADYGLETLEAAATALGGDLGFAPARPIPVDILRNSGDLATMTTLTDDEIERTGTVAVSKWSRIMLTSPRAMRLGYEWQDSLSHEFIHYVVAALTHDRAPVWLQEGFAKFLEHRWRMPAGLSLNPSMQHFLAKALASGS
jgi:hypothetical protein